MCVCVCVFVVYVFYNNKYKRTGITFENKWERDTGEMGVKRKTQNDINKLLLCEFLENKQKIKKEARTTYIL